MRSVALGACAVLLLGLVLPAMGALPGDSMPIYPKCKVEFEMTLTEKDFLPAIKQFIPTIPEIAKKALAQEGDKGDAASKALASVINDEFIKELTDSIAGLTKLSVTSYAVPKGVTPANVGDFYILKLGLTKGWQRTLRAEQGGSFARLYTKPDLEAMLGIGMDGQKVVIFTTEGRIDFACLTKLVGKLIPMAMDMRQSQKPTEPPAVEQIPEPSPPADTPTPGTTEQPQTPDN